MAKQKKQKRLPNVSVPEQALRSTPNGAPQRGALSRPSAAALVTFLDKALAWGLGLLCLFISISFYIGTYDTAFVKITLLQMGGISLSALWFCLLAVEQRSPITRQNIVWLLPFLMYFAWNALGYLLTPYPMEAFEEFFRYIVYFLLGWMVLDRFAHSHTRILTRCIIGAAWISCLYGLLQVVDRWWPGADVMPWRGFFGARIFSTHANPNFFADFLVFSLWIMLAEYLRTRSKRFLVLAAVAVVDLFFSESKGAWLGFAASAGFFMWLYAQAAPAMKKYARKLTALALVLACVVGVLVGVYAVKRFQSVSFRAYTWKSTFEMVQDSPIMGTGVGSFKTIYPAYRKPQIFYIEKAHNNETQHAENEYLEQWATAGTIGLAIFLWLIFFVLYGGWRRLKQASEHGLQDESYWLLGYMAAFFGICVHNFFDVSMRFVSTGLFFAVFSALIVRLSMPASAVENTPQLPTTGRAGWVMIWRIGLTAAVGWLVWCVLGDFAQVNGNVGAPGVGGWLVKAAGWGVLGGLVLGGAWMYLRAAWLSRWARVPFILLLSVWPLQMAFGFFMADHYYGIAAAFSARASWDGALEYYARAIEKNPFNASYHQYRAYVLRNTQDLQRVYAPLKGDRKPLPTEKPLTDYERVLRDLDFVKKRSPNNALLHHTYGEFYYQYAVYFTKLAERAELPYQREEYEAKAVENMNLAKQSFAHSLLLDPVYEATYVYLTSIAMMERNPAAAQAWIEAYRRGPEGVTEPEFLQTHQHSARLEQMERQLHQPPFSSWWK